jgi:hypothetical protein
MWVRKQREVPDIIEQILDGLSSLTICGTFAALPRRTWRNVWRLAAIAVMARLGNRRKI